MKILLVAPYTAMSAVYNSYLTSLGVLSLATVLKDDHCDVEIADFNSIFMNYPADRRSSYEDNLAAIVRYLVDKEADVVGFGTLCASLHDVLQVTEALKKARPDTKIIIGGPQSLHLPDKLLAAFPWLDVICVGEAETIILPLMKGLAKGDLRDVPGIVYRSGGQIVRNLAPELIANLDDLPYIDYSLVPYVPNTRVTMEIGRGCPYQCVYCSTSLYWQRKFRTKSLFRIRKEIERIKDYVPAGDTITISFVDDNFTTNRRFAFDLCELLAGMGVNWDCSARLDTLDEVIIAKMAASGCKAIFIGVETGSPRMQKTINKNLNLDRFGPVTDAIIKYGIEPVTSYMYGFPGETEDELKETLRLICAMLRKGAARCGLHALCIIGGTKMYEDNKDDLVLRDQCSNIVDTLGMSACQELMANNKELFSHVYTLEGSLAERFLYLEKFMNLVVMSMFTVFPQSIIAVLDIFNDDLLALYEDFIARTEFASLLRQDGYVLLAMSKPAIFKATLKCYFGYIATKALGDFRFELIKHQLWNAQEKLIPNA